MPRKTPISIEDKELCDRIFSLFPDEKDAFIAEKVCTTRQLVQGWRSGKSRPTLNHIRKISEITKVNVEWIISGETTDIEALTYAFFPIFSEPNNTDLYDEARRISGVAIWMPEDGECDICMLNFSLNEVIHALAALWWSAIDVNAPDPMAHIRYKNNEQPDELEYIKHCSKIKDVPPSFIKRATIKVIAMRLHYHEAKLHYEFNGFLPHSERIPNAIFDSSNFLSIIGRAAADNAEASRAELEQEIIGHMEIPEYAKLIQVIGDSMDPVVLDGQYVIIGKEINHGEKIRKPGLIAVVEVTDGDGCCEHRTGTYCKRIYPHGDDLMLVSINHAVCEPFSVPHKCCRIWPVIGVWFGGKGMPPRE